MASTNIVESNSPGADFGTWPVGPHGSHEYPWSFSNDRQATIIMTSVFSESTSSLTAMTILPLSARHGALRKPPTMPQSWMQH